MHFSAKELDDAADITWALLMEGKSDMAVMRELGVDISDFNRIKARALDKKAEEFRRTPVEHVYAQYMLNQAANIKELAVMIRNFKKTRQHNAMVGALRLRADLYDRILTKGQECGLIHRAPEKKQIVAGIAVADMSNKQLQGMIVKELEAVTAMMGKFGDRSFMDVEAGEVHHGPALPAANDSGDDGVPPERESAKKPAKKRKKQRVTQ